MKTINVFSIKLKSLLYTFLIFSIFAITSISNVSFGQVQLDLQNTSGKIATFESSGTTVSMDFNTNTGQVGYIGATIDGFEIGSPTKDLRLFTGAGGTCTWTSSNGGRFGIDNISPSSKLHVSLTGTDGITIDGDDTGDAQLMIENGGGTHRMYDDDTDAHALKIESAAGKPIVFNTNGTNERMIIESGGNVGIGVTDPQAPLHITGTSQEKIRLEGTSSSLEFYDGTTYKGLLTHTSSNDMFLVNALNGSLSFRTNNLTRMRIDETGDVGIGTTSPSSKLHLFDADEPTLLIQSNGNDEESGRVSLRQDNGSGADILYDGTNANDVFAIETFTSGNSNGYKMTMDLAGDVNIVEDLTIGSQEILSDAGLRRLALNSTFEPLGHLFYDLGSIGNILAWDDVYADDFVSASDIRLKEDIQNMEYGLDEILSLSPISYKLIADPQEDTKLGLSAQELLEVIPEVVKTHDIKNDEEGNTWLEEMEYLGVSYNRLVPVLINAVKEQNALFEQQKSYIESLEARINALEK